ncbi:hypothetical protein HOY80DRAFT_947678 [Tuber brumale]|nr:hypothetical protein HOY80DRAFT_947678 [Tuber brumale]
MGNFCSRGESIRKLEIEIGELRNDIARLARDREASEAKVGDGRTAARASSGGRIYDQGAASRRGRMVERYGRLGYSGGPGGRARNVGRGRSWK